MILVFVGAGGSASVDPKHYPTTVEFFKMIPNDVKEGPVFSNVHEYLRDKRIQDGQSIDNIDIEEVLWGMSEVKDYYSKKGISEVVEWTMNNNLLNQVETGAPATNGLLDLSTRQ